MCACAGVKLQKAVAEAVTKKKILVLSSSPLVFFAVSQGQDFHLFCSLPCSQCEKICSSHSRCSKIFLLNEYIPCLETFKFKHQGASLVVPRIKIPYFQCRGGVGSLVRELRAHMPCDVAKTMFNNNKINKSALKNCKPNRMCCLTVGVPGWNR